MNSSQRSTLFAALAGDVAAQFGVATVDMLGSSRKRPLPLARKTLWARMYRLGMSYDQVARIVGRDRSTVYVGIHSIREGANP